MLDTGFYPKWTERAPEKGTYRSILKWGDPNEFKHPNSRLYKMMKEKLNMTDDDFKEKQKEGNEPVSYDIPIKLSKYQIDQFKDFVGEENASIDDYSRLRFSYGKTMIDILRLRNGIVENVPDVVLHPRDKIDVQKIVSYCNEQKIPIYPYGGGSSVTRGTECVKGGISLVMTTHMNRVLEINETNQTVTVEPGLYGPAYEEILNNAPKKLNTRRKYTCGHFPQSFEYSTVGGWIVTLGAGQQSSYYGDIYNIVVSQEYVTPAGTFKTMDYPATATGPKINDIMKGSEGSYGILVGATLKIFRYMPENRNRFAFMFSSWEDTVNASREICQAEFGMPSVFRISDPEETDVGLKLYGIEGTPLDTLIRFRGYKPMERCLCIGHTEGEKYFSENVKKKIKEICANNGAMFLTGYPVMNWEHSRYRDPYMREDLQDYGIMIDTLECSVMWDNLHKVHQGVRKYIKNRENTVCMTHASHFYPQGTNLYFIFIAKMNDIEEYKKFQYGILDQILKSGASMSHHHGIGKMIAPWMENHIGKEQLDVLKALKRHFDPNNIMNPGGTLGLDLPEEEKRKIK
ncbi:MAG: FAD-binding oxidoreductase [Desulfobacterales bacterium]|nr:FAD-binding oxidoreductase [Desulfobacterales bacterium]MBF0395529.1 FAD-binding oxidoreductase [Desulfobacterales bacterium]